MLSCYLVHKLKLVSAVGNLCATLSHDAVVLIAVVATTDAIFIYLYLIVASIRLNSLAYLIILRSFVLLEWQVLCFSFGCVLWRFGRVLRRCAFLRCFLRVGILLLFLPCVHESDAVRIGGDLDMALAVAVCP